MPHSLLLIFHLFLLCPSNKYYVPCQLHYNLIWQYNILMLIKSIFLRLCCLFVSQHQRRWSTIVDHIIISLCIFGRCCCWIFHFGERQNKVAPSTAKHRSWTTRQAHIQRSSHQTHWSCYATQRGRSMYSEGTKSAFCGRIQSET